MGFQVATAKCDQIEQVWPGAPVIAMLRSGREPLAAAPEYEQIARLIGEPLLLADRIASQLENAALAGPLLLAIDDLQWADQISKFLVRTLVSRLIGLPVVWLLASRDGNVGADLADYDQVRVERLRLGPLSTQDLADMARDGLGFHLDERTQGFLAAADGNPFLATQIVDSLARSAATGEPDAVPAEFTAAVADRMAELGNGTRDLIQLIAVAGRPLPLRDAAALMPGIVSAGSSQVLAEAVESGLITAADDTLLAFRHDLVREAVYAGIPASRSRSLHRMFAEYCLTMAADPLIAASHARAAVAPGDTLSAEMLVSAAEMLADINADDAAELAALAFHTVRPATPEWLKLGMRCLRVMCQTQRAAEAITIADLILASVDDSEVTGQVETDAARALWLSGRVAEMTSRADRILRLAEPRSRLDARMRAVRALASTRTTRGDAATRTAQDALSCAREAGDREAMTLALQAAGEAAKNEARHHSALGYFRELRSLTGAPWLAEEITELQFLDRYDHAQVLLDKARDDSRSATKAILPAVAYAQAWQHFSVGHLDAADATAQSLVELGQQLGDSMYALNAIIIRLAVSLLRGETDVAAAQLQRANTLSNADSGVRSLGVAVASGWVAAARGGLEEALVTLRPVVEGANRSHSYWPLWPCWNGLFFEFAVLAGDYEFAGACVDIAETAAARNPGVASYEGVALNLRGRRNNDLDTIAKSADVLGRSPRSSLRALGADTYGRALLDAGRRAAGLAHLDRAWSEYHEMGAWALRTEVQRVMRGAGARRTKWTAASGRPSTGWQALTETERRVAELIGSGHTNKSAAAELGVSINTIGTHVRAVFTKLSIQSRVQLANMLHKQIETTG